MMYKEQYGVLLFVEGDTEEEFYRFLLDDISKSKKSRKGVSQFIIKNLHGIGGFKRIALRYFLNRIKPKYNSLPFYIVLAYDTDVFEFSSQPPIDWRRVDKLFREYGAIDVIHIKQRFMIEDWVLLDLPGLCKHLGLASDTPMPRGKDGNDKMQQLFYRANRLYYKGHYTRHFLDELDMDLIYSQLQDELKPLVDILFY